MNPKRPMKRTDCDSASIDEYAEEIWAIWPQDEARPVLQQWLAVVAHASVIAEEVRKTAWDHVLREIAEVFVWWLSFVYQLSMKGSSPAQLRFSTGASPSDIVWFKFANACPVCFGYHWALISNQEPTNSEFPSAIPMKAVLAAHEAVAGRPCGCLARKAFVEKRSRAFKKKSKQLLLLAGQRRYADKPSSLKALEDSLKRIFQPSIDALSIEEIAFHLLEEIGEVSEALDYLHFSASGMDFVTDHTERIRNLSEELADVFSWLVALRQKTYQILECATRYAAKRHDTLGELTAKVLQPTESLVGLIWDMFGSSNGQLVCEDCKRRPCVPQDPAHGQKGVDLTESVLAQHAGELQDFHAFSVYK